MYQENIQQPKKSFFRRFWWIGAIAAVLIIGVGSYSYFFYVINVKMSDDFLNRTEKSLSSGITIEDEENDFASMGVKEIKEGGKPNNPAGYNYPYLDIKFVSAGIDKEYLYFKIQFRGTIPESPTVIDGDKIIGNGIKVNIVDENGEDMAILLLAYNFVPVLNFPLIGTYYLNGPTGIKEPEGKRFSDQDYDSKVSGGAGTDYLIGALPFKKIGLSQGQTIYFTVSAEAESEKYDHAAVDVLGGHGKMPAVIKWKSGTKEFEIDDDFYTDGGCTIQ